MNRILLIDDEDSILSSLSRCLTHLGYRVTLARDGEEGIRLFHENNHFDVVLTGICMPKMSGNDVARHIRESVGNRTPVIAMTGSDENNIRKELFICSLVKPFRIKALLSAIQSLSSSVSFDFPSGTNSISA
jgi:DNA-binding response OmpR family regulator